MEGKMRYLKFLSCIVVLLVTAAIAPTAAQTIATATPYPTYTFYPTYTLYPTYTPLVPPTRTPTLTKTPNTAATGTRQARIDAQTATAAGRATQAAIRAAGVTSTAEARGTAAAIRDKGITRTARARREATAFAAQYTKIDYRQLRDYADNCDGDKIKVTGRVFNVVNSTEFQLYFAGTYDAFYVELNSPVDNVFENDLLTVYGVCAGYVSFENSLGGTVSQPLVRDAYFEKGGIMLGKD